MSAPYDIAVVGSGIAGSTLALVLGRLGWRVLVVDKGRHPRFVIGESTVPTTTLSMRQIARRYDVPEIEDVAHYLGLKKHGLTGFPKRLFWFGIHRDGHELEPRDEIVLDTFPLPIGPDVHMLRADADGFLVSRFPKYGVEYLDQTAVADFQWLNGRSRLLLKTPRGDQTVTTRFVIDASGHSSVLANLLGLRETPPRFRTNTRSIFGHFRSVRSLDEALDNRPHPFRFQRDSGTLQHCFDGGWIWVIPFDDGLVSVGLMLDCDRFPDDPNRPPEEELREIIDRFPTVRRHLGEMTAVRPLIRTGRVQFSSSTIVGDGFLLTPHATAFIDPLFSTGILLSMTFLDRLVPLLEAARREDDFSPERFRPLEEALFREVDLVDLAVSGMIASFRDVELFRQYWRIWVHASGLQYFAKAVVPPETTAGFPIVYGAGFPQWCDAVRSMHEIVTDRSLPAVEAARMTKAVMDAVPHPFRLGRYTADTGRPLYIHTKMDKLKVAGWMLRFLRQPELKSCGRLPGYLSALFDALGYGMAQVTFGVRYLRARRRGEPFHAWVDNILKLDVDSGQRLAPIEVPESVPVSGEGIRIDSAAGDAAESGPHGGRPSVSSRSGDARRTS